jgi:hypothetical protein
MTARWDTQYAKTETSLERRRQFSSIRYASRVHVCIAAGSELITATRACLTFQSPKVENLDRYDEPSVGGSLNCTNVSDVQCLLKVQPKQTVAAWHLKTFVGLLK